MIKIYKRYSTEKQRTQPILSIDCKCLGFLSHADAHNIAYSCTPIVSAIYKAGETERHFELVSYKFELYQVDWDNQKRLVHISRSNRAAFKRVLKGYDCNPHWIKL